MQNRNKEMLKNLLIKPFLRCETVHVNTLELKVFNVVRPLHVVLHVCLHLTGVCLSAPFSVFVCVCVCLSFSPDMSTLTCPCTDWLLHAEPLPLHAWLRLCLSTVQSESCILDPVSPAHSQIASHCVYLCAGPSSRLTLFLYLTLRPA